jgi:hypothetical protein
LLAIVPQRIVLQPESFFIPSGSIFNHVVNRQLFIDYNINSFFFWIFGVGLVVDRFVLFNNVLVIDDKVQMKKVIHA